MIFEGLGVQMTLRCPAGKDYLRSVVWMYIQVFLSGLSPVSDHVLR